MRKKKLRMFSEVHSTFCSGPVRTYVKAVLLCTDLLQCTILSRLNNGFEPINPNQVKLLIHIWVSVKVVPLCKSANPVHHKIHTKALAQALDTKHGNLPFVIYVDVAKHPNHLAFTLAAVNGTSIPAAAATVNATLPDMIEEAIIALAITITEADTILSYSKTPRCNFAKCRIDSSIAALLRATPPSTSN